MFNPLDLLSNILFVPIAIAVLILKGIALWKAAKQEQKGWFIALMIFQTLGILELVYLFIYQKDLTPQYRSWFKPKTGTSKDQMIKDIEPEKIDHSK